MFVFSSEERMSLASTIKTLWFPDISRDGKYEIVSADANIINESYVKIALFKFNPSRQSHSSIGTAPGTDEDGARFESPIISSPQYTVDIVTNEVEKSQLEV